MSMSNCRLSRKMIHTVAILVLGLILSPIMAQAGTLRGSVTDQASSEALLGAIITVTSADPTVDTRGSATDENGSYEVTGIPAGDFTVTITYVGFVASRTENVTISESGTETINADLVPDIINVDAISVTASRRREKVLDAPASISVVSSENIHERTTLTPTEHIKGLPAVDVATTGLNQSNVVVRGFNNIFSGALLVLTDNRIARVPSLRFNAHNFLPTANNDIEAIEIVSGPGSALYGPNAAAGVMHIVTRSPFGSEGTTFSIGGGERDLIMGSFRHAGSSNQKLGYKITGQYYRGHDWESSDRMEPDTIQFYRQSPTEATGREYFGSPFENKRDFDIEKLAAEARVDYILNDNASLIVNGGFNRASSIELTGLGAAQAVDWGYYYAQTRFQYKDLFAQAFVNGSDAGESYLLQTGQLIVDKSKLWVGQIQHQYAPTEKISLTYGADAFFTRPATEGTINGRNEADDNIDEFGLYLQGDMRLSPKFKLLGAARYDTHNQLEDGVFSPRAAAVYQPNRNHNFRLTYNRAFSTPDNNNLYLDLLQAFDPFGTGVDIRVQGVPETGFHWDINSNGARYRSPFAPLLGDSAATLYDANDMRFTNIAWTGGRGLVMNNLQANLDAAVAASLLDPATAAAVFAVVDGVAPLGIPDMGNVMRTFNIDTRSFDLATTADIADIERMKPTITQTFEVGYKGVINNRLSFRIDGYRTKKHDFIGPLTIETPNVFLDPADLAAFLGPDFAVEYGTASDPEKDALDMLDNPAFGGNGNGTPIDELTTMFTTGGTMIALGTASPNEAYDPTAVLVTYRNFGDISFYGLDMAFDYHLTSNWNFGGSYSYVSKNFFDKNDVEGQVHDIRLNAPRHKFAANFQYVQSKYGLIAQARLRYVDAYEMDSPFEGSLVESYRVVDLNVGVDLMQRSRLNLSIQNILDNKHSEFVGAPEIGRLAILRLTHSL